MVLSDSFQVFIPRCMVCSSGTLGRLAEINIFELPWRPRPYRIRAATRMKQLLSHTYQSTKRALWYRNSLGLLRAVS